ncbi:folliculin-like [Ptychodera flava]|uniref:folliculin-like n=1 Tax=Ptychodera flava TaxID=63121 RepID=UPI00396A28A4
MNAIISLCHFCEVHGPSVVFCTQPFHAQQESGEDADADLTADSAWYCDRRVKSPTTTSVSSSSSDIQPPSAKTSDFCEACRSFLPGQSYFISKDTEAGINYTSSQFPDNSRLYSIVRQACLRSLSCEVCPGREGPIYFGDELGHVLSHTFFMKDSQARGLQRWYSIIVVMMDRIYLLNSWPFLVTNIRQLIDELQSKAEKVYKAAEVPPRAKRMTMEFMTPGNFRRQRSAGGKVARSLIDLTNDRNIFKYLHMSFAWILKACGNRLTEKLLEGTPTEDALIDLEKQEETEEGFIKITKRSKPQKTEEEEEEEDKIRPFLVGGDETTSPGSDDEVDLSVPVFESLRHMRQLFGAPDFQSVAHHVLIGNQVIIRCDHPKTVESAINVLKQLLPSGCCRIIPYSNQYEDSWKCNFLGLPPGTALPDHVTSSELYILVDIVSPSKSPPGPMLVDVSADDPWKGYGIVIGSCGNLPERAPAILCRIDLALSNHSLTEEVVSAFLVALKEEWMNKVKVLFKFSKAGTASKDDTDRLLKVLGAKEEDEQMLKFWITGLSAQHRSHLLTSSLESSSPGSV